MIPIPASAQIATTIAIFTTTGMPPLGSTLRRDAAWLLLNDFARVPVCGLISQYSATTPMWGIHGR
jgi:hypothetical protein